MKISIAICTWNRSELLKRTLQSLVAMRVPDGVDWELLLIDNRSTDDTKTVVSRFQELLPLIYHFQPIPGHAASRNAAIDLADGDFILWTDNDVVVSQDWLNAYVQGIHNYPDAAYFGGKIEPVFSIERPKWIVETWEKCKGVYAARDLGNDSRPFRSGEFPYGANFAVRTDIQKQFRFNTNYGRMGNSMVGDEEIAVLKSICRAGHVGIWLGRAGVQHIIPADRITTDYVAGYFVGQGQTNIIRGKVRKSRWKALCESIWYKIKWSVAENRTDSDEWVSYMIRCSLSRGEYLALSDPKLKSRSNTRKQPNCEQG